MEEGQEQKQEQTMAAEEEKCGVLATAARRAKGRLVAGSTLVLGDGEHTTSFVTEHGILREMAGVANSGGGLLFLGLEPAADEEGLILACFGGPRTHIVSGAPLPASLTELLQEVGGGVVVPPFQAHDQLAATAEYTNYWCETVALDGDPTRAVAVVAVAAAHTVVMFSKSFAAADSPVRAYAAVEAEVLQAPAPVCWCACGEPAQVNERARLVDVYGKATGAAVRKYAAATWSMQRAQGGQYERSIASRVQAIVCYNAAERTVGGRPVLFTFGVDAATLLPRPLLAAPSRIGQLQAAVIDALRAGLVDGVFPTPRMSAFTVRFTQLTVDVSDLVQVNTEDDTTVDKEEAEAGAAAEAEWEEMEEEEKEVAATAAAAAAAAVATAVAMATTRSSGATAAGGTGDTSTGTGGSAGSAIGGAGATGGSAGDGSSGAVTSLTFANHASLRRFALANADVLRDARLLLVPVLPEACYLLDTHVLPDVAPNVTFFLAAASGGEVPVIPVPTLRLPRGATASALTVADARHALCRAAAQVVATVEWTMPAAGGRVPVIHPRMTLVPDPADGHWCLGIVTTWRLCRGGLTWPRLLERGRLYQWALLSLHPAVTQITEQLLRRGDVAWAEVSPTAGGGVVRGRPTMLVCDAGALTADAIAYSLVPAASKVLGVQLRAAPDVEVVLVGEPLACRDAARTLVRDGHVACSSVHILLAMDIGVARPTAPDWAALCNSGGGAHTAATT